MYEALSPLIPGQAATRLLLVLVCLLAGAATRAAPCHDIATVGVLDSSVAGTRPVKRLAMPIDAASALIGRQHEALRGPHPDSRRHSTHGAAQSERPGTLSASRTGAHHGVAASPAGDCCEGGDCAMDCGCAAVALMDSRPTDARPVRSALLMTAAIGQLSPSPSELLRPPIPA